MKCNSVAQICFCLSLTIVSRAQMAVVTPQIRAKTSDGKVTIVYLAAHFVSAVRLPEPVNSIAVGDPSLFQVEHSEREPELVLVKALTEANAETNLLVTSTHGRQFSLLLVNLGKDATPAKVDFLLQYKPLTSFVVEPQLVPFPLIGQTSPVAKLETNSANPAALKNDKSFSTRTALRVKSIENTNTKAGPVPSESQATSLDDLLARQEGAPLPPLYGERIEGDDVKGDRLRVGISEVLDGGDQVIVLFSAVNTSKHAILLMPPQVQLGGKSRTGKLVKHDRWSTAEQLPVSDFRLSRRRIGTGERADGVVAFERPPYKQSREQLFLQMAESGAVDRPALAPIGFGVSSIREEEDHGTREKRN
jgi:hypothetical protein